MGKGWKKESERHSKSAKGIKTGRKAQAQSNMKFSNDDMMYPAKEKEDFLDHVDIVGTDILDITTNQAEKVPEGIESLDPKKEKLKSVNQLTVADVKQINKGKGQFFFSKDTMQFFNSKVETSGNLINNKYFITSEKRDEDARKFTIRRFDKDTGDVDTVGDFQEFSTKGEAIKRARELD